MQHDPCAREEEAGGRGTGRWQELFDRHASDVSYHAASPYASWKFHHWYGGVCG